jgi:TonB family protein
VAPDQWHYSVNKINNGPVSEEELRNLLEEGAIDENTLIWREGLSEWTTLSTLGLKKSQPTSELMNQDKPSTSFLKKYYDHPARFQIGLLVAVLVISSAVGIWLLSSNNEGDSNYDSFSEEDTSEAPAAEAPESSYEEYGSDDKIFNDSPSNEPDINLVHYRVLCSEYGNADFKPGPEFIHVDIEIVNNSNSPVKVSGKDVKLVSANGREYEQANTYSGNSYPHLIYETLNPSIRKKYTLDFDIPRADSYKLVYSDTAVVLHAKESCFESFSKEEFGWLKSNPSNSTREATKPSGNTTAKETTTIVSKKPDLAPASVPIESELRPYEGPITPDWSRFMQVLGTRASQWKPPSSAAPGWVVLSLTITSQGQLMDATVKDSSGNVALEQAAINAAKAGQPYPLFPDGYSQDTVKVDYHFDYAGGRVKQSRR